jgi:hypothetical protein
MSPGAPSLSAATGLVPSGPSRPPHARPCCRSCRNSERAATPTQQTNPATHHALAHCSIARSDLVDRPIARSLPTHGTPNLRSSSGSSPAGSCSTKRVAAAGDRAPFRPGPACALGKAIILHTWNNGWTSRLPWCLWPGSLSSSLPPRTHPAQLLLIARRARRTCLIPSILGAFFRWDGRPVIDSAMHGRRNMLHLLTSSNHLLMCRPARRYI